MTAYEVKLKGHEVVAEGTMAFHFEKPVGFSFKPGQAIDLLLIDPPAADAQRTRHTSSLVSAPFEGELVVATRMRDSAFKRALKALRIGSPARLEGTVARDRWSPPTTCSVRSMRNAPGCNVQ